MMWKHRGQTRPDFALEPGPGEESVWDYPRPPALEPCERRVEVKFADRPVASTVRALRVLETASPPTYYIPPQDVDLSALMRVNGSSFCEWKGAASYWALVDAPTDSPVGWSYPRPTDSFASICGWLGFYPSRVECFVDGERVQPQAGDFYGGWITAGVVGPFKGDPGTSGW